MIIFNAMGGLGNQLYQYAAARKISIINNTSIRHDVRNFRKYTKNIFHLPIIEHFNTPSRQASLIEILILKYLLRNVYKESMTNIFKNDMLNLKNNFYIQGYFLSYKYFNDIKHFLIRELTPNIEYSSYFLSYIESIRSSSSVSIHFRRGDYLEQGNILTQKISSIEYYNNAINYITKHIKSPKYYIFSDDIEWVKNNIKIKNAFYVKNNSKNSTIEDFWMMRNCKHSILSGASTFSWWAAYLDTRPNKIVIHPDSLARHFSLNKYCDYFPSNWTPMAYR